MTLPNHLRHFGPYKLVRVRFSGPLSQLRPTEPSSQEADSDLTHLLVGVGTGPLTCNG